MCILLQSGSVSPCLRYNILNVLYAYAYVVRLFNGDHFVLCIQASQVREWECAFVLLSSCLLQLLYPSPRNNIYRSRHTVNLEIFFVKIFRSQRQLWNVNTCALLTWMCYRVIPTRIFLHKNLSYKHSKALHVNFRSTVVTFITVSMTCRLTVPFMHC